MIDMTAVQLAQTALVLISLYAIARVTLIGLRDRDRQAAEKRRDRSYERLDRSTRSAR